MVLIYLSDRGVWFLLSIANTGESHQSEPEAFHESPGFFTSSFFLRKVDEAEEWIKPFSLNFILYFIFKTLKLSFFEHWRFGLLKKSIFLLSNYFKESLTKNCQVKIKTYFENIFQINFSFKIGEIKCFVNLEIVITVTVRRSIKSPSSW